MKLYRLAHKEIASRLEYEPMAGCVLYGKQPFYCAFDSIASAILESSIYLSLREMPKCFSFVEFRLPDHCWISAIHGESIIDPNDGAFNGSLGTKAKSFLLEGKALVASFPSIHWRAQLNYLINPFHPLFREITLTNILPCI